MLVEVGGATSPVTDDEDGTGFQCLSNDLGMVSGQIRTD